ncbi:MAG: glycosyltransferase [Marinicaulis sp.]|nr:glycosyltransferase [Marinicaulis sp.]
MRGTVIIFAKAPRAGAVKTRLAKGVGVGRATALFRVMAERTIAEARNGGWRTMIAIDPDHAATGGSFYEAGVERIPQGHGDLGKRMDRAIKRAPAGPVIVIGADAPGFRAQHLRAAFDRLRSADAVIGPADDGGYWLIGFARRRPMRCYFGVVRWSTTHALQDTLAGLPETYRIALLEELHDVDDARDLLHFGLRSTAR